ncbi:hypothetical protein FQN55_003348 [Onygenales sp. PD_40]|nr:hypothetical protein FQN55_003348 [Onygenales sp. PD_40]
MRPSKTRSTLKEILKKGKLGLKQTYKSLHLGKTAFASKPFTPQAPLGVQNSGNRGPIRITVTEVFSDLDERPARKTIPLSVKKSLHSWFPMIWKRAESNCQHNPTQGAEVPPPFTSGYCSHSMNGSRNGYGEQMSDTSVEIQRCKEIVFESHPTDRRLTALPTESNSNLSIPDGTTVKTISTDWPPLIADMSEPSSEYIFDSRSALQYIHDPCDNCPHFIGFETVQSPSPLPQHNQQGDKQSITDWIAQLPDSPQPALRRAKKVQNLHDLFKSPLR